MSIVEKINQTGRDQRPGQVKVWDIAVRLFHWSLVVAYAIVWLTADEWDRAHEVAGYLIGGLLLFRLVWGLIGPSHARFSDFLFKPSTVFGYLADSLKGRAKRFIGHNPAGGAMVIALLVSLGAVTITGIAMTSNMFWGLEWVEDIHEVAANSTLILVGLHIAGVVYASFVHRENLVRAMISGFKRKLSG